MTLSFPLSPKSRKSTRCSVVKAPLWPCLSEHEHASRQSACLPTRLHTDKVRPVFFRRVIQMLRYWSRMEDPYRSGVRPFYEYLRRSFSLLRVRRRRLRSVCVPKNTSDGSKGLLALLRTIDRSHPNVTLHNTGLLSVVWRQGSMLKSRPWDKRWMLRACL